jgi:glycosidase
MLLAAHTVFAQKFDLQRVEPPNWWVGMQHEDVQLICYGKDLSQFQVAVQYPGVTFKGARQVENPDYLFIDLAIGPDAQPGNVPIVFTAGKKSFTHSYELMPRKGFNNRIQGVHPGDFIYLIMPDRFANGDPSNDRIPGMRDQSLNRDSVYFRHGGDLKGIQDRIGYLKELGVTALWLNPVLENDQPKESYHGYAATESYRVDRRFGGNKAYLELIEACQAQGIKVVKDIIHNHFGDQHWTIRNMPMRDWVHQHATFTRTSYRAPTVLDPYASEADKKQFLNGWFDHHMPDLNQSNELVANYLIYNNIWWIEYAGIDAFRMDTYAYSDPSFLEKWGKALLKEYPHFSIFGEVWDHGTPTQAFFHGKTNMQKDFNALMPSIIDFQLYYAINDALSGDFGWTSGLAKIYYTLAHDFLYQNPNELVTFLDNHDLSRFHAIIGKDLDKFKMGVGFMLTTRGIPSLYYGTEILYANYDDGRGAGSVREDFMGGWPSDPINKFDRAGRNTQENEAWDYVSKLANYRKNTPALYNGKLVQFVPLDGTYVYFRTDGQKTIMVMMNTNTEPKVLETERFREMLKGKRSGKEVVTGQAFQDLSTVSVPAKGILIIELD